MSLAKLKAFTQARIDLKRSGHAIATSELLKLRLATALAQDAVMAPWNIDAARISLEKADLITLTLSSCVDSRSEYLKRPDLGRRLSNDSTARLNTYAQSSDLVVLVSDGLSARAVEQHFVPLFLTVQKQLAPLDLKLGPVCFCPFSRVAICDEIGFLLKTKLAIMFIGERPGLSAQDSLSIYLTYDPKPGNRDSDRNCISNIRPPDGLSYQSASHKLIYLIESSLRLKISGVKLKEATAHNTRTLN